MEFDVSHISSQTFEYVSYYLDEAPTWVVMAGTAVVTAVAMKVFRYMSQISWNGVKRAVCSFVINLPYIREKVKEKIAKEKQKLEESHLEKIAGMGPFLTEFPDKPLPEEKIMELFERRVGNPEIDPDSGRISGGVYYGDQDLLEFQGKFVNKSLRSNPLHAESMTGYIKVEAELIRMLTNLFHGDEKSCGTATYGGTYSILHACWSYRVWAEKEKGIKNPQMVVPKSAHASFDKASRYFGVKLVKVPLDPKTMQVNVQMMERAINKNTIMIVGSAPAYPHGIVDPIQDLAEIAKSKGIPLHVDCCLGGPVAIRAQELGTIPPFDFSVEGVTSISTCTHKFFQAPKGTSAILYRSEYWRHYQMSMHPDVMMGVYATPTFAGSRTTAIVSAAWATLLRKGKEGYDEDSDRIMALRGRVQEMIGKIPELKVIGDPKLSVVAFKSGHKEVNIYNVADQMKEGEKKWELNCLQPAALHFCVTSVHTKNERFLEQFEVALRRAVNMSWGKKSGGTAKLYGTMATVPTFLVEKIVQYYFDLQYRLKFSEKECVVN